MNPILCVICARGGSKGLPNKNIRMLHGVPLIAWSIKQALATPGIEHVVVSTDSPEIASVSREFGATIPFMRPPDLALSNTSKFNVFQHAYTESCKYFSCQFDMYLDLDCTSPLRSVDDISSVVSMLSSSSADVDGVFTVSPARKNPYFNIMEPDSNGYMRVSKALESQVVCRQEAPPVFDHVASIYALRPNYLLNSSHLFQGNLLGYDIGESKSLDVDSEFDFRIIEFLTMGRKL